MMMISAKLQHIMWCADDGDDDDDDDDDDGDDDDDDDDDGDVQNVFACFALPPLIYCQ